MSIDLSVIDDFLFSMTYTSRRTELEKAKEIASQLALSIYWLQYEAKREINQQNKADILKEITAAERELSRINKNIDNLENNNE